MDIAGIALLTAFYGAVLSTYNAVMARLDKRRRVKVTLGYSIPWRPGEDNDPCLQITAANLGDRAVTLGSASIRLPDGRGLIFTSPYHSVTFPHRLEPGSSCDVLIEVLEVAQLLKKNGLSGKVKLRGVYGSAVAPPYLSKRKVFDVDGNLKRFGGEKQ
jgi:hypothetical protein